MIKYLDKDGLQTLVNKLESEYGQRITALENTLAQAVNFSENSY